MGKLSEEDLAGVDNPHAKTFLYNVQNDFAQKGQLKERCNWKDTFPDADPLAIDLLGKLLEFNPDKRINVA
jgi:mitogen-activated protein kinase 1/3